MSVESTLDRLGRSPVVIKSGGHIWRTHPFDYRWWRTGLASRTRSRHSLSTTIPGNGTTDNREQRRWKHQKETVLITDGENRIRSVTVYLRSISSTMESCLDQIVPEPLLWRIGVRCRLLETKTRTCTIKDNDAGQSLKAMCILPTRWQDGATFDVTTEVRSSSSIRVVE